MKHSQEVKPPLSEDNHVEMCLAHYEELNSLLKKSVQALAERLENVLDTREDEGVEVAGQDNGYLVPLASAFANSNLQLQNSISALDVLVRRIMI